MTLCGPCLKDDHTRCYGKQELTRWTGRCECYECALPIVVNAVIEQMEDDIKRQEDRCRREQR